jgi:Tfp pilus assembly protein PilN
MNAIKFFYQKILSFLRIRTTAGGLEISDEVLRLVYFDGKTRQMAAVRLAPGVMEKGKLKNADAFITAMRELKLKVPASRDKKKKMNVVVSMSSVNIYSQVFTLPLLEGEELTKAIALNVQMLSPVDVSQEYSGWQILGKDEVNLRLEVLVAFIDKKIVDETVQALFVAGFLTVDVESRALALTRILREKGAGIDVNKSYLLLNIDNSGMDFLVIRKGQLYFEYTNQWADIADEKGQIPVEKFETTLTASLRQVANFYNQHWPEPLSAVILSAAAFGDEAEKSITAASLPIINLTLVIGTPVSSEWLVVLGCSLRGLQSSLYDKEINLSGEGAQDTFQKEKFLHFLDFWRIFVPLVLAFLIVISAVADSYFVSTKKTIESQSSFTQQGQSLQQIAALEASSTAFNQSVALFQNAEQQQSPIAPILTSLTNLAANNGVTISHISFTGANAPILLSGVAQTETQIQSLESAISADPKFGPVTLPLSGIQLNNQIYSFSMTFPLSPSALR